MELPRISRQFTKNDTYHPSCEWRERPSTRRLFWRAVGNLAVAGLVMYGAFEIGDAVTGEQPAMIQMYEDGVGLVHIPIEDFLAQPPVEAVQYTTE